MRRKEGFIYYNTKVETFEVQCQVHTHAAYYTQYRVCALTDSPKCQKSKNYSHTLLLYSYTDIIHSKLVDKPVI